MSEDEDYEGWLQHRREVSHSANLVDRIMAAVEAPHEVSELPEHLSERAGLFGRVGPPLLWTAASLFFVARIAALVGNLVFPTSNYPEFAVEERIEEMPDERPNVSRS